VRTAGGNIARGIVLTLLLALLVVVLDRLHAVGELALFVLAGAALIPLSWLIGEATDNLADRTGPGIGGGRVELATEIPLAYNSSGRHSPAAHVTDSAPRRQRALHSVSSRLG
jgi:hypothetical protein